MKRILTLSILFLFIFSTIAEAQRWRTRRWEAYAGGGTANVYGDIGGAKISSENWYGFKDYDIEFTRPSISFGVKYKISHRWFARVNFSSAFLQGNDRNTRNEEWGDYESLGRMGGYKYISAVIEPSALAEFYILPESRSMVSEAIYNKRGMVNGFNQINLYLFTGVGGVASFPSVKYMETSEPVPADDGYQEGVKPFQRFGLAIPVGIGVRYSISPYWTANIEIGRRYTTTDYIDGYSSKFSEATDVYDFAQFILSYKIRTDKNGWPVLRKTGLVSN